MRVLSGIQPSGQLHLGNYFGMMKPVLDQQDRDESFVFIADYHALTTIQDAALLQSLSQDVALDFLACGLDPQKTAFYRQSDVPEVTELSWYLSILTPMGLLERCHSYKDKLAKGFAPSHGLFAYPVLMSADILIVNAEKVPVGRDQKQHLEVARDIAIKFNNTFGETFHIPEPDIREAVAVVPGLDGQKMSKSYGNTIEIFGDLKAIRKKMMRIITDSKGVEDVKDPETSYIYQLYKLLASESETEELAARYRAGGMGYGEAKKALFERFEASFSPFRDKRSELENHPDYVEEVLRSGAARAREEASKTLQRVRRAVGISA